MHISYDHFKYLSKMREQRDTLLAALEAVEWVESQEIAPGTAGGMKPICPWCGKFGTRHDKWAHYPGCQRQAAIAQVSGSEP